MPSIQGYPDRARQTTPHPDQPVALSIKPEAIPQELRRLPRWVLWQYVARDGKWTKPPISPHTGQPASVTDPATWATFAEALKVYQRGGFDGIGFILTGDGTSGIDLDHCRDPQTGELAEWAEAIIAKADSYTEVSPSGTGIRILTCGRLPHGGRKRGPVEMYDDRRYLTVTGQQIVGTPATVNERTDALASIHAQVFTPPTQPSPPRAESPSPAAADPQATAAGSAQYGDDCGVLPCPTSDEALLTVARRSRSGAKFVALFDHGDIRGYASPSDADIALCGWLAWLTGRDAIRMDQLFRQSALYRDKWDTARGDETYGARTIRTAIAGCTSIYRGPVGQATVISPWEPDTETNPEPEEPVPPLGDEGKHEGGTGSSGGLPSGEICIDRLLSELAEERSRREQIEAERTYLHDQLNTMQVRIKEIERERDSLREVNTAIKDALGNKAIGAQCRITTIMALFRAHADQPEAGTTPVPVRVFLSDSQFESGIAARAGVSTDGAGRDLMRAHKKGLLQREAIPVIRDGGRITQIQVTPPTPRLVDSLRHLAAWRPQDDEAPKDGHGGKRVPRCPDCGPGVPVYERRQWVCGGCGEMLDTELTTHLPMALQDAGPYTEGASEDLPPSLPADSPTISGVALQDAVPSQADGPTDQSSPSCVYLPMSELSSGHEATEDGPSSCSPILAGHAWCAGGCGVQVPVDDGPLCAGCRRTESVPSEICSHEVPAYRKGRICFGCAGTIAGEEYRE